MSKNISVLPIWKKNSTPAEWLQELAAMALVHPERFNKMVLAYEETLENSGTITRQQSFGLTNEQIIYLLEVVKLDTYMYMTRNNDS